MNTQTQLDLSQALAYGSEQGLAATSESGIRPSGTDRGVVRTKPPSRTHKSDAMDRFMAAAPQGIATAVTGNRLPFSLEQGHQETQATVPQRIFAPVEEKRDVIIDIAEDSGYGINPILSSDTQSFAHPIRQESPKIPVIPELRMIKRFIKNQSIRAGVVSSDESDLKQPSISSAHEEVEMTTMTVTYASSPTNHLYPMDDDNDTEYQQLVENLAKMRETPHQFLFLHDDVSDEKKSVDSIDLSGMTPDLPYTYKASFNTGVFGKYALNIVPQFKRVPPLPNRLHLEKFIDVKDTPSPPSFLQTINEAHSSVEAVSECSSDISSIKPLDYINYDNFDNQGNRILELYCEQFALHGKCVDDHCSLKHVRNKRLVADFVSVKHVEPSLMYECRKHAEGTCKKVNNNNCKLLHEPSIERLMERKRGKKSAQRSTNKARNNKNIINQAVVVFNNELKESSKVKPKPNFLQMRDPQLQIIEADVVPNRCSMIKLNKIAKELGYTIMFRNSRKGCTHPYLRVLRAVLEQFMYDCVPKDKLIVDVGGNSARHMKCHRVNVHSTRPIVDVRDIKRIQDAPIAKHCYCYFPEVCRNCSKPEALFFVHSLYYIPPDDIGLCLLRNNIEAYSVHHRFVDGVHINQATWRRNSGTITMSAGEEEYVHKDLNWLDKGFHRFTHMSNTFLLLWNIKFRNDDSEVLRFYVMPDVNSTDTTELLRGTNPEIVDSIKQQFPRTKIVYKDHPQSRLASIDLESAKDYFSDFLASGDFVVHPNFTARAILQSATPLNEQFFMYEGVMFEFADFCGPTAALRLVQKFGRYGLFCHCVNYTNTTFYGMTRNTFSRVANDLLTSTSIEKALGTACTNSIKRICAQVETPDAWVSHYIAHASNELVEAATVLALNQPSKQTMISLADAVKHRTRTVGPLAMCVVHLVFCIHIAICALFVLATIHEFMEQPIFGFVLMLTMLFYVYVTTSYDELYYPHVRFCEWLMNYYAIEKRYRGIFDVFNQHLNVLDYENTGTVDAIRITISQAITRAKLGNVDIKEGNKGFCDLRVLELGDDIQGRNIYQILPSFDVNGIAPWVFHENTTQNAGVGFAARQMADNGLKLDEDEQKSFEAFIKDEILPTLPIAQRKYSKNIWLKTRNWNPRKKRLMASVLGDNLNLVQYTDANYQSHFFVKEELVNANDSKPPRVINARDDAITSLIGPIMATVYKTCQETFSAKQRDLKWADKYNERVVFTSGTNRNDIGKMAHELLETAGINNPIYYALDFSRYDSTINSQLLYCVQLMMLHILQKFPELHNDVKQHVQLNMKTWVSIHRNFKDGGRIKAKVTGTRRSGDTDTTIGNTLLTYALMKYVDRNKHTVTLIAGDDTWAVTDKMPDITPLARLGIKATVQESTHISDNTFNSSFFAHVQDGLHLFALPGRLMTKGALTTKKLRTDIEYRALAGEKARSLINEIPQFPGVCKRLEAYVSYGEAQKCKLNFNEALDPFLFTKKKVRVVSETLDDVAHRYGCSVLELLDFDTVAVAQSGAYFTHPLAEEIVRRDCECGDREVVGDGHPMPLRI